MRQQSRLSARIIPFALILAAAIVAAFLINSSNQSTPAEPGPAAIANESTVATATHTPPGLSRENPLSGQETISLSNWEVRVLEMVRGQEAWKRIHDANQFNTPPPDGWQYILIRYRIQRKGDSQEENSLGLHLTGDAHMLHYSFNNSTVPPEPILDTYLLGGEKSQGWEAYLIREDEGDLMLVVDDLSDYEEPEYFARLDENASLTVPTALDDIVATTAGSEADNPVPFGQIATGEEWQIAVQQVQQGDEAWARVREMNRFNDPPAAGQMYMLVKVWVHYIGSDRLGQWVSSSNFTVVNHDGNEQFEIVPVSGLEPRFYLKLYPGGEFEGWLPFLVNKGDEPLLLAFNPDHDERGNRRYLSLRQSGR